MFPTIRNVFCLISLVAFLASCGSSIGGPSDLTMDSKLQGAVEKTLERADHPGAVIVVNAQTGTVLAFHEIPGTDPHPLTIAKHPASTMKPFLALAGIHEQIITFEEVITCTGEYERIDGLICFGEHGPLNLEQALVTSCNTFFYEVAYRLGVDRVSSHFANFGFGQLTRFAVREEAGVLPDRQWYEDRNKYWEGAAPAMGIGHGSLFATPLQLARAYVALATGEFRNLTSLRSDVESNPTIPLPYDEASLTKVRQALVTAVEGENGTGHKAMVPGLSVAGKTGTASGFTPDENTEPPTIGWFAGFAPATKPEIVVVVLIEGGGPGGQNAAATAGKIFSAWKDLV